MDGREITEGTQRRTKASKEPCPATKGRPGADRLSALSDELLLHILSILTLREAISTCRLSRRWRYLFHYLPSLDFSSRAWEDAPAWFIDRVLLLHAAPLIEVFRLSVQVEDEGAIDSRLLFAVRRGVQKLDIGTYNPYAVKAGYGLPPWVFHCSTLEDLSVHHCALRLPSHIRLFSLKKMRLVFIQFNNDELKRLLVGCPLLQSLVLAYCNNKSDLVIDARENRKLEELDIEDGSCSYSLHICAPSVKYLTFVGAACRRRYEVRDLSSLVSASFTLEDRRDLDDHYARVFATGLLLRIPQVQVLNLCSLSLRALSIRELQGNLASALPGVTRLELTLEPEELELQATLSALHSCSNLRTLVLNILHLSANSDSDESDKQCETESPRLLVLDSDIVMQDLKTIMIQGLPRYDQYPEEEGSETKEFVAPKMENDIGLIGFLLKVSPVLEKLIVKPAKDIHSMAGKWELLFKLSSDLLSLPRASPKAQVIIQGGNEARYG